MGDKEGASVGVMSRAIEPATLLIARPLLVFKIIKKLTSLTDSWSLVMILLDVSPSVVDAVRVYVILTFSRSCRLLEVDTIRSLTVMSDFSKAVVTVNVTADEKSIVEASAKVIPSKVCTK